MLKHSLEELMTELDSLTPSGNIDNKGNKLFENYSTFYSIIEMNVATTVLKHTIAHLGNHGGTQIWTQLGNNSD